MSSNNNNHNDDDDDDSSDVDVEQGLAPSPPPMRPETIQDDDGPDLPPGMLPDALDEDGNTKKTAASSTNCLETIPDGDGPVPFAMLQPDALVEDGTIKRTAASSTERPETIPDAVGPVPPAGMLPDELDEDGNLKKTAVSSNHGQGTGNSLLEYIDADDSAPRPFNPSDVLGDDEKMMMKKKKPEQESQQQDQSVRSDEDSIRGLPEIERGDVEPVAANNIRGREFVTSNHRGRDEESQPTNNYELGDVEADAVLANETNPTQGGDNESLPIPIAYLVEESDESDHSDTDNREVFIAEPLRPWWTHKRNKIIIALVFVIVATLAIALGVSLTSNDVATASTLSPTFQPTTSTPSFEPSNIPSSSNVPSSSPTSCNLKISSSIQQLDFQLGDDLFQREGIRTPKIAVDGKNAVVVTGDWGGSTPSGYIIFYSLGEDGWERVDTFAVEDEQNYSVALSGTTAFIGYPYANSHSGGVYIYEQNESGSWKKIDQNIPYNVEDSGNNNQHFGWSVDIDGELACVVHGNGAIRVFRRDDPANEYWETLQDDLRLDNAKKCSIKGDYMTIRNRQELVLYKYDESFGAFLPHQASLPIGAGSAILGQHNLLIYDNSSAIVYRQEAVNGTFTLFQRIDSSDFTDNAKSATDDDDADLMSDYGASGALDNGIMVVGGYNNTHIFSQKSGYWDEKITLWGTYDDYQLSGRYLLVARDYDVFSFNLDECEL